jgi:hypothetical protein
MTERFDDFPYDPDSEARMLRGEFPPGDPNRIRGLKDRSLAKFVWKLWLHSQEYERSGRAAAATKREREESEAEEKRVLTVLADDALAGRRGTEAKHLASKCLLDSNGIKHYELTRLRALREGLRKLRAAERGNHG